MGPTRAIRIALLVLLCLAPPLAAHGHAIVVESVPRPGVTVSEQALAVVIRFSSRIDRARSHLTLIAGDGKERSLALTAESAPDLLRAEATGLMPGAYRLRWQVLALDGHITRGDIPFTVIAP
ncbi:MAG: copper resistance protein CopC [Proteobacteria bacterium]|nr:copper resistance protein CopC [Pseudomonadota bacterium]MBI3499084.1 copper resistance protein CopC [Pseudomonadota bacterium]